MRKINEKERRTKRINSDRQKERSADGVKERKID